MEVKCVKYGLHHVVKRLLILAITIGIFAFLVIIFHDILATGENAMESLPEAFFALLGMKSIKQMEVSKEVFFIIIGILNLFIMGMISIQSANIFEYGINLRAYAFFLYQPYGRVYYYIVRCLSSILYGFLLWIGYIIECEIALAVISAQTDTNYIFGEYFIKMGAWGLLLVLFMIGAGILYSTLKSNIFSYSNIVISVIMICFLVGNAYKVPNLIAYYMRAVQRDTAIVDNIGNILNNFTWLHPLEQLNIFMIQSNQNSVGVLYTYVSVGIIFIIASFVIYMKKDLRY